MTPEKVVVRHAAGEYPVFCGANFCDNEMVRAFCAAGVAMLITDETVKKYCAEYEKTFPVYAIPSGEKHKTLQTMEKILDELAARKMRRDGTLIAFGGGVVGDVAGFAAASYMRGVRLIQIPTTLLAQVDAAVGGKTGVNHLRGKNLIGAFYQPAAVFCDSRFLSTLPEREYRAGLAEIVKYAMLGDYDFFVYLEKNAEKLSARESKTVNDAVLRSVQMKAKIVGEDERETGGRRALLNLGHTFAHGLENAAGYGEWLHGEAVAAGLVAAAKLSEKLKTGIVAADVARVSALLKKFKLPISFGGVSLQKIENSMNMDKKFIAAESRFVLINAIGDAQLYAVADKNIILQVLEEMR